RGRLASNVPADGDIRPYSPTLSSPSVKSNPHTRRGVDVMHSKPDTDVLRKAVLVACRAPSVPNSQPWRWVADGESLRLFIARYRTVPGRDDSGREAIMSCGVVLDHLRVAMLAAGWHARIERFPNLNDPDNLASIEFSPVDLVTDTERLRADAIVQRR